MEGVSDDDQQEAHAPLPARGVPARRTTTRALLVAAGFGAIGAVVLGIASPLTTALAVTYPPAYAIAAGLHSVLPFVARRVLGFDWAATLVGAFVGLLSVGFTPLGVLIVVPLTLGSAAFDATLFLLRRRRALGESASVWAAGASAVVLYVVSLPVMSAEHLAPVFLVLTFLGRIIGQLGAVGIALLVATRLRRAGIRS